MLKLVMIQPLLGGNCHQAVIVDLSLRKEYLAAAVDYVRFHSLMLDFKAVRQEYLESIAVRVGGEDFFRNEILLN